MPRRASSLDSMKGAMQSMSGTSTHQRPQVLKERAVRDDESRCHVSCTHRKQAQVGTILGAWGVARSFKRSLCKPGVIKSEIGACRASQPAKMNAIGLGLLARVALLTWGAWQDAQMDVKFTDIDYEVYTDAAQFMAQGGSPYERSTYRYTPLLAALLLPNVWVHRIWGKLLFSAADLLAAR